jgi:hypothetical protein
MPSKRSDKTTKAIAQYENGINAVPIAEINPSNVNTFGEIRSRVAIRANLYEIASQA